MDRVETRMLLSNFAQQFQRETSDVRIIYFILLDAAGIYPTLVLIQNTKTKKRGS